MHNVQNDCLVVLREVRHHNGTAKMKGKGKVVKMAACAYNESQSPEGQNDFNPRESRVSL